MTSSVGASRVDMNDPWNLNSYSQLLLFQNNLSMDSISFNSPTKSQQQALQLLAHGLGLEYEYYLSIRRALILRPIIWGENSDYSAGINPMDLVQNYGQPSELIDSNDYLAQQSVPLAQPNDVRLPLRPSMSELGEHTYWQLPQTSPTFQLNQPSFPPSQSTADMEEYVGSNSQNSNPSHLHSQQQASFHVDDSRQARETGTCPGTGPLPAYDPDLGPRTTPEQAQHIRASNIASPTLPVAQTILPQQARPSRSASVHSVQSVQGRNRIEKAASRKSSIRSAGSSMFSCFDSRSDRSLASHVSNASRRSKRSLDKFARAAVKAVKAIGACWRCKFLRKSCSDETPCGSCPRNAQNSEWQALGCRRGHLKEQMSPLLLCSLSDPQQHTSIDSEFHMPHQGVQFAIKVNQISRARLEAREADVRTGGPVLSGKIESLDDFLHALDKELPTRSGSSISFSVSLGWKWPAILLPLDECVQSIIWELSYLPASQVVLQGRSMQETASLLRSIALCQVTTDADKLIAQSLICLRDCLEVLRIKAAGHFQGFSHRKCKTTSCQVDCIANLDANISRYIGELSRVFFLKESTRNIRTWWISGFCSFVIQGFVRRALMEVLNDIDSEASEGRCLGAREYLQLAVRLFVASTRTYDPLIRQLPQDYISEGADDGGLHFMEVKIVQLAVKQIDWKASGIEGSGDYLKRLFEDDGRNLLSNAKAPAVSNYPHLTSEDDENEPSNFSKSITGLWKAGPPEPEFDPSVKSAEKHQTIDLTDLVSMRQSKYLTEKSRFASLMLFRSSPGKPASL